MTIAIVMLASAALAGCLVPGRGADRLLSLRLAPTPADCKWTAASRAPQRRPHRRSARRSGELSDRDLPIVLDLLAVCLAAGALPTAALAVVGSAFRGPLADELVGVSRALELGASGAQAWSLVLASGPAALRRAADRFAESERTGAALAPALATLAADCRRSVQLQRGHAVRRVGVLAAAPLGLCFLPAFVLVGVLPVVAGLVAGLSL